jgi:hypothetical protein
MKYEQLIAIRSVAWNDESIIMLYAIHDAVCQEYVAIGVNVGKCKKNKTVDHWIFATIKDINCLYINNSSLLQIFLDASHVWENKAHLHPSTKLHPMDKDKVSQYIEPDFDISAFMPQIATIIQLPSPKPILDDMKDVELSKDILFPRKEV